MSGAAGADAHRFGQERDSRVGYALCREDGFWFRPAYTDGKCPLCGEFATAGWPELSAWARVDRFTLGMAALVLAVVAMSILVLFMYVKG